MKFSKLLLAVVGIIVFIFIAGGAFLFIQKQNQQKLTDEDIVLSPLLGEIIIGNKTILVEIAKTLEVKTKGLSGREFLKKNQGMLFVYERPGFYSFWMKEMRFPIDIIWISENHEIIDVTKNISPDSFPKTFRSQKPAQYVLEVNAGFSDKNNIQAGDRMDFSEILFSKKFEEISHIDTGTATEFAAFKDDIELWVTNIGAHYVSLINIEQNKIIDQIAVGETPHGISFSTDKTLAFVSLYESGEVVIINVAERTIIKKVKVGEELHNSVVVSVPLNEGQP